MVHGTGQVIGRFTKDVANGASGAFNHAASKHCTLWCFKARSLVPGRVGLPMNAGKADNDALTAQHCIDTMLHMTIERCV